MGSEKGVISKVSEWLEIANTKEAEGLIKDLTKWIESKVKAKDTECSSQQDSKSIEEQIPELAAAFYGRGRNADLPLDVFGVLKNYKSKSKPKEDKKTKPVKKKKREVKMEDKVLTNVDLNSRVEEIFDFDKKNQKKSENGDNKTTNDSKSSQNDSPVLDKTSEKVHDDNASIDDFKMLSGQIVELSKKLTLLFYQNMSN